jgi:hypothetical protein
MDLVADGILKAPRTGSGLMVEQSYYREAIDIDIDLIFFAWTLDLV